MIELPAVVAINAVLTGLDALSGQPAWDLADCPKFGEIQ
jgi:hypothetical protein